MLLWIPCRKWGTVIKKLVINSNVAETRIALLEGERVAELYIERHSKRGMVGNIYKGRVTRVLPGMQSAFVDIGVDRSAFLFSGDVMEPGAVKLSFQDEANSSRLVNNEQEFGDVPNAVSSGGKGEFVVTSPRTPIEKLLRCGQEIIVQVAKVPLGSKGPRVTMQIAVPGRYLVLMPDFSTIGISRRIEDEKLRDEIRAKVEQIRPPDMGLIVRTAAANVSIDTLKKDLEYLLGVWERIKDRQLHKSAPDLVYQEPDLVVKTVRDLYAEAVTQIVVDDAQAYTQLKHFLCDSIPGAVEKLTLYEGHNPVFDEYGIEMDLAKALARKVWLPSGGYLVIDQTEALTSFDVNTGKYVGSKDVQDTIFATNIEAALEIAHQLRIRNLGGIIVIDFIDMEKVEHRDAVCQRLEDMLKADKARTNVLPINELGLVQMTRKRTAESLERVLTEECAYCSGRGRVLTFATQSYDLVRDIERYALRTGGKQVRVKIRDDLKDWITENEALLLEAIIEKHGLSINFESSSLRVDALWDAPYEVIS